MLKPKHYIRTAEKLGASYDKSILYDTQPVAQILALFMGYLIVKKTLKIICDFYHVCV